MTPPLGRPGRHETPRNQEGQERPAAEGDRGPRAKPRHPCTGQVSAEGFPDFLARELGPSRRNLKLFAEELAARFGVPRPVLTNSGSSANLAAACGLAERAGRTGSPG